MSNNNDEFQLTEGSTYKILSIAGRQEPLSSQGVFKGYVTIGIEEGGIRLELDDSHTDLCGKTRLVPLHAILAIDVIEEKHKEKPEEKKETHHYYS